MLRHATLVKLQGGEVICPRKSNPFPAVISVMNCVTLHDQAPGSCAQHKCLNFVQAAKDVAVITKHVLLDQDGNRKTKKSKPSAEEELENDEKHSGGAP